MRRTGPDRARGGGPGAAARRGAGDDRDRSGSAAGAGSPGDWDAGGPRGRLGPGLVLVVLAAVAALGLMGRGSATVSAPEPEQFAIERATEQLALPEVSGESPAARRARRALEPLPLAPMGWGRFVDAPLDAVADSPVVATGTGIAVVGARDGRLALAEADLRMLASGETAARRGASPSEQPTAVDDVWTELPTSPLSARADPYLAVAGADRYLVWGGREGPLGGGPHLTDGAVLDAGTGLWQRLPDLPSVTSPATAGWVGDQLTVVGRSVADVPVTYGWSVGDSNWRSLAAPPTPAVTRIDSVAVDGDLLVYGVTEGLGMMRSELFTLAYDVEGDAWRSFEHVPLQSPDETVVVPMDDGDVFMWGRPSTNAVNGQPDGLVLSVRDGSWGQVESAGIAAEEGGPTVMLSPRNMTATWTRGSVVVAGDTDVHMLAYIPTRDVWQALAMPPETVGARIAFSQGHLVRWGGMGGGAPQPQLWIFPAGVRQ